MENYMFDSLAITGGIGSGKSTVLKLFEEKGFTIISADTVAHSLLKSDSPYFKNIAEQLDNWLGTQFINQNEITRVELRQYLNTTPNGFKIIAGIAKPYILKAMQDIYSRCDKNKTIFEIPLLIEENMVDLFSKTLVVMCDMEKRKERIRIRDPHFTEAEIEHRIHIQATDRQRLDIADYIINNSGNETDLRLEFEQFFQNYQHNSTKIIQYNK